MMGRLSVCVTLGFLSLSGAASADLVACQQAAENEDMRQVLLTCNATEITLAAEQGDDIAQYMLGDLYSVGELGVERNLESAIFWYTAAAEQGNPDAQLRLASMYTSGRGLSKNLAEAYRLYTSAAKLGSGRAQLQLGLFYQTELRDNFFSYMWVSVAALNGYDRAVQHKALMDRYSSDYGLSNAELSEAYGLAERCLASGYSDCEK